jgi:cytochrome d ubiquinol oxidase subunit I
MTASEAALLLARAQFGLTIGFHIVLAAFTIGLSNYLMVLEALWLWKKEQVYIDVYSYWLKIFAMNVAVGVVSGVVMEFEFGTNWGRLSTLAGAVIGPLMLYEVIVAFFLEAGFLGIMLFGMKKVGARLHFVSTVCVASGSLMSAFWILSANSWMNTPAGYAVLPDGRFIPTDWMKVIFNPSFPFRFVHMSLAVFLATAFLVGGVGGWHLLHERDNKGARLMFSMALWMALFVAPLQMFVGDKHGENTLEHQPQKVAAMEGDWQPKRAGAGEPLVLFAIPDMKEQVNHYEVSIPHVASLYLRHNWGGVIKSLREFPRDDIPPVPMVFFAFRIMVGLGIMMTLIGIAGFWLRMRGRLYNSRLLQRMMYCMAPAGFVAMLAGWTVTEVGRQPYTVYRLLRTAQSSSPIALPGVAASAAAIVGVYVVVFGIGFFYMLRVLSKPPVTGEQGPNPKLAALSGAGGAKAHMHTREKP